MLALNWRTLHAVDRTALVVFATILVCEVTAVMEWLRRTVSGDPHAEPSKPKTTAHTAKSNLEKLSGYHDLAKEAFERAYAQDVAGDRESAAKLYQTGINITQEGLSLEVPVSGLGPAHSNTARWRGDMVEWQQAANRRLRDLNSPVASTSTAVPAFTRQAAAPRPAITRSQTQPARGIATPGTPPKRVGQLSGGSSADSRIREVILAEVLDDRPSVRWDEVAGLSHAKQAASDSRTRVLIHDDLCALREMVILPALRSDLFQGLRAPARGLLLYGPPGNGKTMLAKALAHEAQATFFNISASSLTSKWHGEAEKLVRALFALAAEMQPSIIFIDEIDSILSERSAGEHEASRRLKTQFLVEFDGVARGSERIVVIGATNRPQELDDAVRRRLVKRIYIPMPDAEGRRALLKATLAGQPAKLSRTDVERIVGSTEGYSGSDLAALCREAAMAPIRELGDSISTVAVDKVRKFNLADVDDALSTIRPSVARRQLAAYEAWTREYGTV